MTVRIVWALVQKDASLFFRNRLFAVLTLLGLVFYVAVFYFMPGTVDETLKIGLYATATPPGFERAEEGLVVQAVESEEILREQVIEGAFLAGIAIPGDLLGQIAAGQKPEVTAYFVADIPGETKSAIGLMLREIIFTQTGQPIPVQISEEVLGPDLLGRQIPPRDRLRPLLALLIILTETMVLATLISEEVERRTLRALLITPATVTDIFVAKGITGTGLAFGQAVVLMGIIGGIGYQPSVVLAALLLGAVLVTGIAFILASLGKDMMSVMAWGVVVLTVLMLPSLGVLFPGLISDWVKAIPSYYLVETVHLASNFGMGWDSLWGNMLALVGFDVVAFSIGIMALGRKTR